MFYYKFFLLTLIYFNGMPDRCNDFDSYIEDFHNKREKQFVCGDYIITTEVLTLLDSAYLYPKEYMFTTSCPQFIYHNNRIQINLFYGDEVLIKKSLEKNDFIVAINNDYELIDYGILKDVTAIRFDSTTKEIKFNVNISIPLTDIGVRVSSAINKSGEILLIE